MSYDKESCVLLMKEKQAKITDRYVRRSDFTDEEVVAIKSFLGPWPRALEAAGLKPERSFSRIEKNREKRERARRRRREEKKAAENEIKAQSAENKGEKP